jgi:hypothetical protein
VALSRSVIHPRFLTHHRASVKSLQLSRVRIERVGTEGVYDPETGTVGEGDTQPLYQGRAAIEKVARPTRRDFVFDAADNQVIEVQIPLEPEENELAPETAPDYQSGDRVRVLSNPANPSLEGQVYYVHGDAGSSFDWVMNLVCRTSAKQGS